MPRHRQYPTNAARQWAYRQRERRRTGAPDVVCSELGLCTLFCSRWEPLYTLLPRRSAVVADPPYQAGYDYTKARRRPSQWDRNFVGATADFDPAPWLSFPEVILFGADHYHERLPRGGSWLCWDKLAGTTPADFAPCEWAWISKDLPPQFVPHLWRGGQRAGEENIARLPVKHHPAQKPLAVLQRCVQLITPGLVILDPFMGSGSTLVACVREGRPCIGIEMDPAYYAIACARVQAELQARPG
jgi:hypothetical protein